MMNTMQRIYILILFGLSYNIAFTQSRSEIIKFGDNEYKNENYASAAYFYKKAVDNKGLSGGNLVHPYEAKTWNPAPKKNKNDTTSINSKSDSSSKYDNPLLIHKLAHAYRKNSDYLNAEKWFAIAINLPIDEMELEFTDAGFWYGEALMKNNKYDEAIKQFENYKAESTNQELRKRSDKNIIGCYYALDNSSTKNDIVVTKSDSSINAGTSTYSLNYFGDEMTYVYSTAKSNEPNSKKEDQQSGLSDFYTTQKMFDGGFSESNSIGFPINSTDYEGAGVLSIDKTTFYFTRKSATNSKDISIWVSKYFNGQWMSPIKLDKKVNVEGFKSMHPALSLEGDILYYASNRSGGQGGMDIWFCTIDEYGGLSEPTNMGNLINTTGDEVTPFFNYFTKTLYFSSDAHGGIGGLDIYKSSYNEDEDSWGKPTNLGRPFNSNKDDAYFIIDKKQENGYLSSDRIPCDCDDRYEGSAYCYNVFQFVQPDMVFSISGTVFNAETDEVIPNALISFKDIRSEKETVFLTTDEEGNYKMDLEVNWDLFLKAQKAKYFGDASNISTSGLTESKHFIQDFFLTPIPTGELEIPGIEYDFDKATLRPKSKEILDKLIEFLTLNDNIVIEIRAHTDARGNDDYNLKLSQKRAQSVVDYLIKGGVSKERLQAMGKGETEPLDDCSKYEDCGETGKDDCDCHQKNRRTAFKTLSEDFKDVFKEK
ncbi:MAG: hypothetical protein CO022_03280 [Flavobacteriales bacterium CG_4_9_14_0_2_um_filter_32_27]|nr:MAG: hypothetical protein CO022_03280 [Flavobacteriales bacterium CG_4_9_14_0_2_um_filter_32_27]